MRGLSIVGNLLSLFGGLALVWWAQVHAGGAADALIQWPAMVMVSGGTGVALSLSYPWSLLAQTWRSVRLTMARLPESPEPLVAVFAEWAVRVRRRGIIAADLNLAGPPDPFLERALGLATSGADATLVRTTLEIEHRVALARSEDQAEVLESAGGYAPTLGIVAAVLGLMRAMTHVGTPAEFGAGIAEAFVATLYGLGAANMLFLPLAMRLRTYARLDALRREFTIDGVLALHEGMHPRLVEDRLGRYVAVARGA